jgi:hypothetical protein
MRKIPFLAWAAMGLSALASAQNAGPPAANPNPTDIDPAVNTSSPDQSAARETSRPQDIDPAVNTSSPSQAPEPAASPASPSGSASSTAAPARSSTATKPAGNATAQGAASTATGTSAPNTPATAAKGKGKALDRIELDTTQITGNRELPKVLYIVPWKRSDLGDLVGKPVNSLLDEVLTPVDRDVFKRENRYYRALTPGEEGNPPAPAAGNATPANTSGGSAAPASRDER